MTVSTTSPDGDEWKVRRAILRGRDGHGRRIRWRGPDPDLLEILQLAEIAQLAEVPVIGVIALGIAAVVLLVVALLFLPAIALGLVEILLVSLLFVLGALAATLFGRPILVRAEQPATGESLVWAVKGWGASREVRDQVVSAIASGLDPETAVSGEAALIARREPRLDIGDAD